MELARLTCPVGCPTCPSRLDPLAPEFERICTCARAHTHTYIHTHIVHTFPLASSLRNKHVRTCRYITSLRNLARGTQQLTELQYLAQLEDVPGVAACPPGQVRAPAPGDRRGKMGRHVLLLGLPRPT